MMIFIEKLLYNVYFYTNNNMKILYKTIFIFKKVQKIEAEESISSPFVAINAIRAASVAKSSWYRKKIKTLIQY